MATEDPRLRFLELGSGDPVPGQENLELIRHALSDEAVWADPPEGVVEGVLTAVGSGSSVPVATRRRWPRVALVGAAAALLLVVLGVSGLLDRPPDPELVVALEGTDLASGAVGAASLRSTPSGWWIRLEVEGLPPAPDDSYYEGWVWGQGEGVSIGTFHLRGGSEPVILWSGVDVAEYPSIRVTLQDEGGGPQASDRVVMEGEVTGHDTG